MSGHPEYSARLPLAVGLTALLLLVGGVGFWSVHTRIAGAVIASGTIVVESNRQVVEHAEGGTVGAILFKDGDRVSEGDILIRLDDTILLSERAVIDTQLVELRARRSRLEAERDGTSEIAFPQELQHMAGQSSRAAEQIAGQQQLFAARRDTLEKEAGQLAERIAQTGNQIDGSEAQLAALAIQKDLIVSELTDQNTLLKKGLVPLQRVTALRREAARLAGEIGRLRSEAAKSRGEIAGLEIEAVKLWTERREAAIEQIRDLQYRELELSEKRRNLTKRLSRLELRAPVPGIVYGSTVFTVGAIISPAEPLMFIIPQNQPLVVSARVDAYHVDQVHIGQAASLRFTAFNQRLTPEISGTVTGVSADVFKDELTGLTYYRVEVVPTGTDLGKLNALELLPGMPVEAYLKTDERTPMSYLIKPLSDYFGRAMRES